MLEGAPPRSEDPRRVAVARFPGSAYASIMRGTDLDVLDANAAFYRAFAAREIACSVAAARVVGNVAWVTCHEVIGNGRHAATNVFVLEGGGWRMVHHQATPMTPPRQARPLPRGSAAN